MNISKIFLSYIKITRPLNVLVTFFVVVIAIFISSNQNLNPEFVILTALAAAFTAAAGNIINDIYDIETDKISHPNRVLVLKIISKKQAWYFYLFLSSTAILISISLSSILAVIVFVVTILLFIYSTNLKRLPLIGNVTIAMITGITFLYGGVAANNLTAAIVPAIFAFLINLIREIVKDILDIDGDSKLNFRTFPIAFGIDKSNRIIFTLIVLLIAFTIYSFTSGIYRIEYFIVVMIFVNPLLVFCIKVLIDQKKENRYSIVSNILKLNMLVGLVAIWLGK